MLKKIEIRKFTKLINDENTVLFTEGDNIIYVYNKKNHKRYYPRYDMSVVRK